MPADDEERIIVAMGDGNLGPVLVVGITEDAWDYLQRGTFIIDLAQYGIDRKLVVFSEKTQERAIDALKDCMTGDENDFVDLRTPRDPKKVN